MPGAWQSTSACVARLKSVPFLPGQLTERVGLRYHLTDRYAMMRDMVPAVPPTPYPAVTPPHRPHPLVLAKGSDNVKGVGPTPVLQMHSPYGSTAPSCGPRGGGSGDLSKQFKGFNPVTGTLGDASCTKARATLKHSYLALVRNSVLLYTWCPALSLVPSRPYPQHYLLRLQLLYDPLHTSAEGQGKRSRLCRTQVGTIKDTQSALFRELHGEAQQLRSGGLLQLEHSHGSTAMGVDCKRGSTAMASRSLILITARRTANELFSNASPLPPHPGESPPSPAPPPCAGTRPA